MFDSKIHKVLMDAPDDVSRLEKLIEEGEIDPKDIKGVMVMHEGDGYARALTTLAFQYLLTEKLGISAKEVYQTIPIQGIAGVAGLQVPHAAVFVRKEVEGEETGEKRLVVAGACTRDILPEESGTMIHIEEVAKIVQELMKDAQIESSEDVHMVFVKGPWQSNWLSMGDKLLGSDLFADGAKSRACGALGVALALGEVQETQLGEDMIVRDSDKVYSLIAHCSSGDERTSAAIILLGNSTKSISDTIIGHGVMEDVLDVRGVLTTLKDMGFTFDGLPSTEDQDKIDYAFLKPKAGQLPTIRGYRHTLYTDPALGPHGWNVEKAPVPWRRRFGPRYTSDGSCNRS